VRNIKISLEYEGTNYCGWQKQKNTPHTIQNILELTLSKILQQNIKVKGASRTDRGVHARMQVANFKINSSLEVSRIKEALNSLLPPDIRVINIEEVSLEFDALRDCKSKTYRYFIYNAPVCSVFCRRYCWHIKPPLNIHILKEQSKFLLGKKDFRSFCVSKSARNTVREILNIRIFKKGFLVVLEIEGRGFLHNMVRNIVGTLVEFSLGKNKLPSLEEVIRKKNRIYAGICAPAQGLFLWKVNY